MSNFCIPMTIQTITHYLTLGLLQYFPDWSPVWVFFFSISFSQMPVFQKYKVDRLSLQHYSPSSSLSFPKRKAQSFLAYNTGVSTVHLGTSFHPQFSYYSSCTLTLPVSLLFPKTAWYWHLCQCKEPSTLNSASLADKTYVFNKWYGECGWEGGGKGFSPVISSPKLSHMNS